MQYCTLYTWYAATYNICGTYTYTIIHMYLYLYLYSSGGVWGIVRCHDFPHIYFITTRNIFHPKSCKKYLNILIPIS